MYMYIYILLKYIDPKKHDHLTELLYICNIKKVNIIKCTYIYLIYTKIFVFHIYDLHIYRTCKNYITLKYLYFTFAEYTEILKITLHDLFVTECVVI